MEQFRDKKYFATIRLTDYAVMGIENNNLDLNCRKFIWDSVKIDQTLKTIILITVPLRLSTALNTSIQGTSPVPFNIDSLFHVRMTNSYLLRTEFKLCV